MPIAGPTGPSIPEIIAAVLEELGVQAIGQLISPEDTDLVMRRLSPKIEELNARDVASLDINNLSLAEFLPFVQIMAYSLASAFSITDPTKLAMLKAAGDHGGTAEQTLKDVVRLRSPRQTMRVELFNYPGRGGRRGGLGW